MSEYVKALIHPTSFFNYVPVEKRVWDKWLMDKCTIVIGPNQELEDISYLDTLPTGAHVVYGGKITTACVCYHLYHVCQHPRVIGGDLHIELSRRATFGEGHEGVASNLSNKFKVEVKLRS